MTFREWLQAQEGRRDPVGDLARDCFDPSCECAFFATTPSRLGRHMRDEHDAIPEAYAALHRAEEEWRGLAEVPS